MVSEAAGPKIRQFPGVSTSSGESTRTCSNRRNSTGRSIPWLGEPGDRRIAIDARPRRAEGLVPFERDLGRGADGLLGPRLDLCARIVLTSERPSLHAIFGSPDDMKFRSCMTLFSRAMDDPDNPFRHALDRWCGGRPDERTLALIDAG